MTQGMLKTAAIAAFAVIGMNAYAEDADQRVTIYLANHAMIPLTVLCPAVNQATLMLQRAGVNIHWRSGHPSRSVSRADWTAIVSLQSETPPNTKPSVLGFTRPQEGAEISVYYDRVKQLSPFESRSLLAFVLVHEITHVLQGEGRHSESGVMKAHWEPRDYSQIARNPFTEQDLDLIHQGLLRRTAR